MDGGIVATSVPRVLQWNRWLKGCWGNLNGPIAEQGSEGLSNHRGKKPTRQPGGNNYEARQQRVLFVLGNVVLNTST